VAITEVDASLWLRVDSFSLLQGLTYLAYRLKDDYGIREVRFRLASEGRLAHLDLIWSGAVVASEVLINWELDAMNVGGEVSPLTLRDVIDRHAAAQPDAPFLFAPEPGVELTYAGLRATARALDAELAARGIRPGEVVSYMLPNGVAAASAFLGAMYGGYVVSPVSLLAQDALIEHTLAHSATRIVFAAPEFVPRLEAILARKK